MIGPGDTPNSLNAKVFTVLLHNRSLTLYTFSKSNQKADVNSLARDKLGDHYLK